MLAQSDKIDLHDKIQLYRNSVELSTILERYVNGDGSFRWAFNGFYADVTGIPSALVGFFDKIHSGKAAVDGLPVDVRTRAGYSVSRFFSSASSPAWYTKLGISNTGAVAASAAGLHNSSHCAETAGWKIENS